MFSKYGLTAVESVELCLSDIAISPSEAWERMSIKNFGEGTSSQKKGCPRGAFLGLCQEGYIKGISKRVCTSSNKNKQYAIEAVNTLKQSSALANDIMGLWRIILNGKSIKHNSQMDVVVSLWKRGLINENSGTS